MLRLKGILMIVVGAMLWGATGPLMEWIMEHLNMSVPFLLTLRFIFGGLIILAFLFSRKRDIFAVWKLTVWRNQLLIFSVFGMLGLQFSFVSAIEASNAAIATLLQFSAPIFVTIYVSLTNKKFPPRYQVVGIVGTLAGLFLLLTNGSLANLLVSPKALLWGLALGLTFSFYTLFPARLMKEWGVLMIIGWSMLISGIVLSVLNQSWNSAEWNILTQPYVIPIMITLIILGTLAFVLFLSSMKYISAVETSILSSVEPLTAMVISVIWFGTMLQNVQLVGATIMLVFVTGLSLGGRERKVPVKRVPVTSRNLSKGNKK